ncbi:LytR C-terminal domain-containing protein [Puerhibacterium puerhi]|uniref:LytR C-terminal domain-containing protein n=1 Tax=Puerhibacterium puerhi TaxID=2692623 RepID=UPI0013576680|nr:LytR C-terminal domain-containing protein [Puerhibacterium puerhi]
MSKSQYSYPPDEFDVRGPDDAPVGVHRAPRSGWSKAWPFLLVAVVCAGIAVGAVSLLSRDTGTPSVAAEPGTTQSAPGDASASPEATPEGSEPAAPSATPETSPSPSGTPDVATLVAAADVAAPIRIVNSSTIVGAPVDGLAAKGADALAGRGFTNVLPTNPSSNDVPTVNTVLYVEGRSDTAAAVAAILGVDPANVRQVSGLAEGAAVTAVLATDITPAG